MSKHAKPPVPVGPHRIGEQFVAQPPTLCLKTAQGERHIIGKIEQLTPPELEKLQDKGLNLGGLFEVYPIKRQAHSGRGLVTEWAWRLCVPGFHGCACVSPRPYSTKRGAKRAATYFGVRCFASTAPFRVFTVEDAAK